MQNDFYLNKLNEIIDQSLKENKKDWFNELVQERKEYIESKDKNFNVGIALENIYSYIAIKTDDGIKNFIYEEEIFSHNLIILTKKTIKKGDIVKYKFATKYDKLYIFGRLIGFEEGYSFALENQKKDNTEDNTKNNHSNFMY